MFFNKVQHSFTRRGSKLFVEFVIGIIGIIGIMLSQVDKEKLSMSQVLQNNSQTISTLDKVNHQPQIDWFEILL